MVRRFLGDGRGLASIMDAFMFLLAMIALGSFLLSSQEDLGGMEDDESQALVDRAHSVLISMTLRVPVDDGQGGDAPCVELTSLIQAVETSENLALPDWALPQVEGVISGLLGSSWGFEWGVDCGGVGSTLAAHRDPSDAGEVFASRIEGSSRDNATLRFILKAWRG
jgi:hypothetical protein